MSGLVVRYLRGKHLRALAVTEVIGGTPFLWDDGVIALPEWLERQDLCLDEVWIAPVESVSPSDLRVEFS
ncbi:MAG: hypothetical protein ACLGG9_10025 [Thermoleophilia bacterium]